MCSESHRIVRASDLCIYEDAGQQGFQRLVHDMLHWINTPIKREGNFHFIAGLKIAIVTILIMGVTWFAWFMWQFIYQALGGI